MKKLICLFLILVIVAILIGCSKQPPDGGQDKGSAEEPLDSGMNELNGLSSDFDDSDLKGLDQDLEINDNL